MQTALEFSQPTYHAAIIFVKQLESELKPLTILERDTWIAHELSPRHNIPAIPKRIRPDFETFQKIRNAAA